MNETIPHTPTDAVQLFIIVRKCDQEISKIRPLWFKHWTMSKKFENGFNNVLWRVSHWNRDRSNILFRSHWLLSSTSYRPSVLQGLEGVRFINHLPETIPTGKLYFRSLVFKSLDEVRKSSPIFFPKQRKSLRSDVNFLRGMLLTLFSKFLAIDWS